MDIDIIDIDLGEVCRSAVDRPLEKTKHMLFSGDDTLSAYQPTTTAWDVFDPVNG